MFSSTNLDTLEATCLKHLVQRKTGWLNNNVYTNIIQKTSHAYPVVFSGIITCSDVMYSVFDLVEVFSKSSDPVLITGESGVGKELIAKVLHNLHDGTGEFVPLNTAGVDDTLFSDTLFGHVKGAYTGAINDKEGLIERASGGTLFLDEIGGLEPASQVKLLRLLQEKEYYPLGSDKRKKSNCRIIAATNDDLEKKLTDGLFRKDLFYRLTHHIDVPPLRERKEDISLLVRHFVEKTAAAYKRNPPGIPKSLNTLLALYDFPGNIRELELMVKNAVSISKSHMISLSYFKEYMNNRNKNKGISVEDIDGERTEIIYSGGFPTLQEVETHFINKALKKTNNNKRLAAGLLGITPYALLRKLKKI